MMLALSFRFHNGVLQGKSSSGRGSGNRSNPFFVAIERYRFRWQVEIDRYRSFLRKSRREKGENDLRRF
jgi:hypothetical protein